MKSHATLPCTARTSVELTTSTSPFFAGQPAAHTVEEPCASTTMGNQLQRPRLMAHPRAQAVKLAEASRPGALLRPQGPHNPAGTV